MKEENKFEEKTTVDIDITEARENALKKAKGKHEWRQRGNKIVCISCEFEHGFFVYGKIMVGVKDGMPILKDRDKL